jgi:glucose-1-phosphate cytidylyltransferase
MQYYAHYGHKDFILALGYRGDMIKEYFLNYKECMSKDFSISLGDRTVEVFDTDTSDWRITFVDTGMHSNLGQRLLRVRKHLDGQEEFLANYSDGLSDVALDKQIQEFRRQGAVASFAAVSTGLSFHCVRTAADGRVVSLGPMTDTGLRVNGGFFCLRREIFDYIEEGDELVEQPFQRLIAQGTLIAHTHDGFWKAMDTFKDKITFDRMEARGECPWIIWNR